MRNLERIDTITNLLRDIWKENPDWRIGLEIDKDGKRDKQGQGTGDSRIFEEEHRSLITI